METIHERSSITGTGHVSCIKYQNLKNISHFHSDHELVYVNDGDATVIVDETVFNLCAKQCVFIYSNDIHCITASEGTVITVLKINERFFEKRFTSNALVSPIVDNDSYIENALSNIALELKNAGEYDSLMADCMTTQLLITLFRREKTIAYSERSLTRSNSHVIYDKVCLKISSEYRTITFKEMAEYMHFSEPYFSKVFHNIFGMTFTEYLNAVKIAVAIEKINENKLNITETASACGFNTIRNFNRVFKKFTGYSPNSLPSNYTFTYSFQNRYGLDPTLNCTIVLKK